MRLALKIAPQHSTQYADMTARLAAPELLASPAGDRVESVEATVLGGQGYLLATLADGAGGDVLMPVLSRLGAISEAFECYDELAGRPGPFLRPLAPCFAPFVPVEMAEARRYRGKTSEVFTRVLLNLALFAGSFRYRLDERLRVLDPLAGGGTTLFLALAAGYDAVGVELGRRERRDHRGLRARVLPRAADRLRRAAREGATASHLRRGPARRPPDARAGRGRRLPGG